MLPDDVPAEVVYAAGDAFVQTSAWEGLPIVILEAMHSGLPVIAYAVGGVPEQVADGRTGFLVAPGDVEEMCGRLEQLAGDTHAVRRLGDEARRVARTRFARASMLAAVEDVYRRALGA